jgi:hypothetical protein
MLKSTIGLLALFAALLLCTPASAQSEWNRGYCGDSSFLCESYIVYDSTIMGYARTWDGEDSGRHVGVETVGEGPGDSPSYQSDLDEPQEAYVSVFPVPGIGSGYYSITSTHYGVSWGLNTVLNTQIVQIYAEIAAVAPPASSRVLQLAALPARRRIQLPALIS